jgi:hypothetical protein
MADVLAASIIRVPVECALQQASGHEVRALTDLSGFHGGTIARADVAGFVLDQVHSNTWLGRSPLVSW